MVIIFIFGCRGDDRRVEFIIPISLQICATNASSQLGAIRIESEYFFRSNAGLIRDRFRATFVISPSFERSI